MDADNGYDTNSSSTSLGDVTSPVYQLLDSIPETQEAGSSISTSADLRDLSTPKYLRRVVGWSAAFCVGTLALRFYPKRPGFLRRTALWGTWCVGGCITSHYDARLRQLAHDAEESGKLGRFWTVVAAVTFNPELQDNIAALPRKLIARHGHSFEEARPLLKSLEEKYYNIPPQTLKERLHKLTSLWLASDETSRLFWMLRFVSYAGEHSVAPHDLRNDVGAVPAYIMLISTYSNWLFAGSVGHISAVASGTVGLFVRKRLALRISAATGICSLAAIFAWQLASYHLFNDPSTFKNWDVISQGFPHLFLDSIVQ